MMQAAFGSFMTASSLYICIYGTKDDRLGPLDLVGLVIWAVGFFFEVVGDYQLLRHKRNPEMKG